MYLARACGGESIVGSWEEEAGLLLDIRRSSYKASSSLNSEVALASLSTSSKTSMVVVVKAELAENVSESEIK